MILIIIILLVIVALIAILILMSVIDINITITSDTDSEANIEDNSDTNIKMGCKMSKLCGSSKYLACGGAYGDDENILLSNTNKKSFMHNVVKTRSSTSIYDHYDIDSSTVLGEGQSGFVRVAIHKKTERKFALKTLEKKNVSHEHLACIRNEIDIMSSIDHPNILKLHESFETDDNIYLLLHLCEGGDLFERVTKKIYSEKQAARYVLQMLGAVRYLHRRDIVHRDLKLENFLLDTTKDDSELKLTDFGYSRYLGDAGLRDSVGTIYYAAPEVFSHTLSPCTEKVDIWALGVLTYLLLSGVPPFFGSANGEIVQKILRCRYIFHKNYFRDISSSAKDFIRLCLQVAPAKRPSADALLKHKWFEIIEQANTPPRLNLANRIRLYESRSRLIKTIMKVIAYTLHPEQIADLQSAFYELDTLRNGEIKINDLKNVLMDFKDLQSNNDFDTIFRNCDFEDNSVIKYSEFIAATISKRKLDESNLHLAFEKLSGDDGNCITAKGINKLLGANSTPEKVDMMFREAQLTPNTKITFDKFQLLFNDGLASPVASPVAPLGNVVFGGDR